MLRISSAALAVVCCLSGSLVSADTPIAAYIYPAGGQRGTTVPFRVGGLYLHDECRFEMLGTGVEASPKIEKTTTLWFEGPVIPQPASQAAEDYPKDLAGQVKLAADAAPGPHAWRIWTSQGAVAARSFIVGDLPEIVEQEIEGNPTPTPVVLPLTINGRVFPREDVDVWSFNAKAGQSITCAAVAEKLGAPFDVHVEIIDAQGRRIAETGNVSGTAYDSLIRFTAPADGVYQAHVHDVSFGGLQSYVYRLTLTAGPIVDRMYPLGGRRGTTTRFELTGQSVPATPFELALPGDGPDRYLPRATIAETSLALPAVELDDLPEVLEAEPNDAPASAAVQNLPAVLNGRIGSPGDVDVWSFRAKKGEAFDFDLRAARLGSPLDSVLTLHDAAGKELARADDMPANVTDSQLKFAFPEDGVYFIHVAERFASRGGPAFAYRLKVTATVPDFRLTLPADFLTVVRGVDARFKLRVERLGGFTDEIKLEFDKLPPGVTVTPLAIPAKGGDTDLVFKTEPTAKIDGSPLTIRGTATIGGATVTRTARVRSVLAGNSDIDKVLLAVSLATPFKVKGLFDMQYAERGAKFTKHFSIDRGGFEGPLEVSLSDKQMRHLQGVTGPVVQVPAGVSEFNYPIYLPPWMELGRTSRSCVQAVGIIEEPDGSRHKVSFTSVDPAEQIILLIDPGQLTVEIDQASAIARPGAYLPLRVRVARGTGVSGPVRVELVSPPHIQGITAEPVTIPAAETSAILTIKYAEGEIGPFNLPQTVRATSVRDDKSPVVAETLLNVLAPR